jgi:hypothetical protein
MAIQLELQYSSQISHIQFLLNGEPLNEQAVNDSADGISPFPKTTAIGTISIQRKRLLNTPRTLRSLMIARGLCSEPFLTSFLFVLYYNITFTPSVHSLC